MMDNIIKQFDMLLKSNPDFKSDVDARKEFTDTSTELAHEMAKQIFALHPTQYNVETDLDNCTVLVKLPAMHIRFKPLPSLQEKRVLGAKSVLSFWAVLSGGKETLNGHVWYAPIAHEQSMDFTVSQMISLYNKSNQFLRNCVNRYRSGR